MLTHGSLGEVAKRSNAADCKSVGPAPSKVRILPSPSAFARSLSRPGFGLRPPLADQTRDAAARKVCFDRCICGGTGSHSGSARPGGLAVSKRPIRIGAARSAEGRRACRAVSAQRHGGGRVCGSNSMVESQPSKLLVAGSIPVSRFEYPSFPRARESRANAVKRATRPARAGEAARERACRGVPRGEAPQIKKKPM